MATRSGNWTDRTLKSAVAVLGFSLCLLHPARPAAQTQTVSKTNRKLVRSTQPDYPMILKHSHVGGSVRLRLTVLPNGEVTHVETLGGNPILVESATKAVLKWKYASESGESHEELQINFNPD